MFNNPTDKRPIFKIIECQECGNVGTSEIFTIYMMERGYCRSCWREKGSALQGKKLYTEEEMTAYMKKIAQGRGSTRP